MAIYISSGLASSGDLNEDDYIDGNNPRIGYKNLVQFGGVTADSELSTNPASNIENYSTAEYWESASTSLQYVYFELVASTWDYVGIGAHNLTGASVQIESRADPGDSWAAATAEEVIPDNNPIIFFNESSTHAYVRIKITPAGIAPKISCVFVGEMITLPLRIYVDHTPINYGKNTKKLNGFAEEGNYLGAVVVNEVLETSVSQNNVSPSYYRSVIVPFAEAAITQPFFFAWRPLKYPEEVGFCWITKNIKPENQRTNGMMSFDINIRAVSPWT